MQLVDDEVAQLLDQLDGEDVVAGTPREFADNIARDISILGKVIRSAGIREE